MTKTDKADMSCARVKQYTASDVSKAERHNERKNETYENMNVIAERIPFNVHFKKPTAPTYMEQLKQMETDGMVSLRGLRKDATLFDEIVIDVNTMYFERNGGYEYASSVRHFSNPSIPCRMYFGSGSITKVPIWRKCRPLSKQRRTICAICMPKRHTERSGSPWHTSPRRIFSRQNSWIC